MLHRTEKLKALGQNIEFDIFFHLFVLYLKCKLTEKELLIK